MFLEVALEGVNNLKLIIIITFMTGGGFRGSHFPFMIFSLILGS